MILPISINQWSSFLFQLDLFNGCWDFVDYLDNGIMCKMEIY